ncbi:hypothetical protein GCM10017767_31500 [Halomonas urumqiensis]|nr:hypothetical protein GCM10017767_31500 [Halomonas urumqiensis]
MSSRRLGDASVELGAQFFSVRHDTFRREVQDWRQAGVIGAWPDSMWTLGDGLGDGKWQRHHDNLPRLTGSPRMSAVARHLAEGLTLNCETRIEHLEHDGQAWWLIDQRQTRHGPFARVVISAPSPQAHALVAPHDSQLAGECEAVVQRPCWAAWACFDAPLPTLPGVDDDWQAVRLGPSISGNPLRFVARNGLKPGRAGQGETLSLLAHLDWSEAHLERPAEEVAAELLAAFADALPGQVALPDPTSLGAHRWRYAQPDVFARGEAINRDHRLSASGLALCGDGFRGPRIEDAWLSGHHLGDVLATAAS